MARPRTHQPTDLEIEILKIIWRDGPSSVREICDHLEPTHQYSFNTIYTMLNIMVKKGYLSVDRRSKGSGGHRYLAEVQRGKTASQMLHRLARRLFGGTVAGAIQHLVREGELERSEVQELRKFLNQENENLKK